MSLNLTDLSRQVRHMSNTLSDTTHDFSYRLQQICGTYLAHSGNEEWIQTMVEASREVNTFRMFALPYEPLDSVRDVPAAPTTYSVVATDGSQVEKDRHGIAAFYLINIGHVYLHYGLHPQARLTSHPTLYYRETDLYLIEGAKRIPIEGNLLNAQRDKEELAELAMLSEEFFGQQTHVAAQEPVVALQDGTLIRWTLANAEHMVLRAFLMPYLETLTTFQQQNIPVASYISRPRHSEVVGTIRLLYCNDAKETNSGVRCHRCGDRAAARDISCSICDDILDSHMFGHYLTEGQRGAIFASMSPININYYNHHRIHFFYMRVGREVARVEIPQWVAYEPLLVDSVHSMVYDQCVRGQGYPVALSRAHEQAVVRHADRRTLLRMIEHSLYRANIPATLSMKQEQKEQVRV